MQIDWITVAAQIVNFLVLVWLLQHFLYGPITRAMDRREQQIANRLREAAEREDRAETEAQTYREKQEELESRRDQLIAEARDKAEDERKSLEQSAREEIERRKTEWTTQLDDQKEEFLRNIRRQTEERFLALSRRALAELANAELENEIASVFVERLEGLEKDVREKIAKSCEGDGGLVVVSSGFDLSAKDKRRITKAVHDNIAEEANVEYRLDDELTCGITLKAGSQTVSWSMDGYFDRLQNELAEEIGKVTREPAKEAAQ